MSTATEDPAQLLHNSGCAPQASIVWRGFGRGPLNDDAERIEAARQRGTWLHLCISIGPRDARYHCDWNSAGALLQLVEPGRRLGEAGAARRLVELIEEHTVRLDWPNCLLTASRGPGGYGRITLDHAPTTFVALAKSAGSLWLRNRPARLAPLQALSLEEPGGTPMRGVRWDQHLWFPDGVPSGLLAQVREQAREQTCKPAPPEPNR